MIKISSEYDIERPYGKLAESEEGRELRRRYIAFNRFLNQTLDELAAPRTFFIIGQFLEGCLDDFSAEQLRKIYNPDNPLNEIQQHTQTHNFLVKPILGEDKPIISPEGFARDLNKANEVIERILGVKSFGLSMPYGYVGDLSDIPEFLKVLSELGFSYVISDARSQTNPLCNELHWGRQPHSYKEAGFPGLVEIPVHGWQDVIFTIEKAMRFFGREPDKKETILRHYKDLFELALMLVQEKSPLYIHLCFEPWAMAEYDPELAIHKEVIRMARAVGEIVHCKEIAREIQQKAVIP